MKIDNPEHFSEGVLTVCFRSSAYSFTCADALKMRSLRNGNINQIGNTGVCRPAAA